MPDSARALSQVGSKPRAPATDTPLPVFDRSAVQRRQEFKYRFGQSIVFGFPVIALQWFGRSLGGAESDRWVTLFQALLAGWVVYVGAMGMLAEGALLLVVRRRRPVDLLADFVVATAAVLLYLAGVPRLVGLLIGKRGALGWPAPFAGVVVLLALWSAFRWVAKKARPDDPAEL